jgi:hypothetical protein
VHKSAKSHPTPGKAIGLCKDAPQSEVKVNYDQRLKRIRIEALKSGDRRHLIQQTIAWLIIVWSSVAAL